MMPRLAKLAAALPAPNPVLVRELRQMARNKFVSIGLCVYLFIQLLTAALVVLAQGKESAARGAGIGEDVAYALCSVFAILALIMLPFFAGMRMTLEKSRDNMDMQFTTTLKPARFADGKILSAAALTLFFAAATAPFLMLAYMLRGVDAGEIISSMAKITVSSALISCANVMIGAASFPTWLRIASMLPIMLPIMYILIFILGMMGGFILSIDETNWTFWIALILVAIAAGMIMRHMAAASLASPHANAQLPLKRFVAIAWLVLGVVVIVSENDDHIYTWVIAFALLSCFLLANAVSMPDGGCSRRVLAEVSPRPLRRRLQFLFFTGAENGICFSLTLFALTILIGKALFFLFVIDPGETRRIIPAMFYAASYLLSARLLWRLVLKRFLSCRYVWFLALVLMLLGTLLPAFVGLSIDSTSTLDAGTFFGNIGGVLSGEEDYIAAHAWMSTLWLSIMALTQIPAIILAFQSFRPPAKTPANPQLPLKPTSGN